MRLLPREEKFYAYFQQQAQVMLEAARVLLDGVRAGNAQMVQAADRIRDLEQKGDEIIHEVLTRLNSTFITPLDPEDIHNLAVRLDDVTDSIEETAHRLTAYKVEPIPHVVVELAQVVLTCAEALEKAFNALAKDAPLLDHCIEINRLEGLADGIVRTALADLFRTEKDPIQLIKLKEVYEILEATTDYCEDVADVLQGVEVKNG